MDDWHKGASKTEDNWNVSAGYFGHSPVFISHHALHFGASSPSYISCNLTFSEGDRDVLIKNFSLPRSTAQYTFEVKTLVISATEKKNSWETHYGGWWMSLLQFGMINGRRLHGHLDESYRRITQKINLCQRYRNTSIRRKTATGYDTVSITTTATGSGLVMLGRPGKRLTGLYPWAHCIGLYQAGLQGAQA